MAIDPRATVDPNAQLADDVEVGPWSIIGPNVSIGAGTVIASHVVIKGPTVIGANNRVYQFATVGDDTTDLKYQQEPTRLVIGDNNVIREGVTIHRGTVQDRAETTIGDNNLFMAYVHIAHDCVVGNHCVFANNAALAGHVTVNDWANLGGYTLIHQYCQLGAHCFTAMGSAVGKDIPAYVIVTGNPAAAKGINQEGLKRRGFSREDIAAINKAFKIVYRRGLTTEEALAQLEALSRECAAVQALAYSLQSSKRGIVR